MSWSCAQVRGVKCPQCKASGTFRSPRPLHAFMLAHATHVAGGFACELAQLQLCGGHDRGFEHVDPQYSNCNPWGARFCVLCVR